MSSFGLLSVMSKESVGLFTTTFSVFIFLYKRSGGLGSDVSASVYYMCSFFPTFIVHIAEYLKTIGKTVACTGCGMIIASCYCCAMFLTANWLVVLIMSKLSNAPDWTESHFLIHHYCLSLWQDKEELLSLNILICHWYCCLKLNKLHNFLLVCCLVVYLNNNKLAWECL